MSNIEKQVNELSLKLKASSDDTRLNALLSLANLPANKKIVKLIELTARNDSSDQIRYLARKYLAQLQEHINQSKINKAQNQKNQEDINDKTSFTSRKPHNVHKKQTLSNDSSLNKPQVASGITKEKSLKEWLKCNRDDKIQIIKAIAKTEQTDKLNQIIILLKKEKDDWVVASLLKAIGILGSTSQINLIQPYLDHSDLRVQANAIEALEFIDDDIVIPLLLPMLERKDHRLCANAIKAIYRFDTERALSLLKEKADSEKIWYRDSAIYCIEKINDRKLDTMILDMYEKELNEDLRIKEESYLKKQNIPLPKIPEMKDNLFDDDSIAPHAIPSPSGNRARDSSDPSKKMSKEERDRRINSISVKDNKKTFTSKIYSYVPLITIVMGSFSLLIVGYALFFAPPSDLKSLTKAIKKHLSPFTERACPFKGTALNFSGSVLTIDKSKSTILIEFDNRRILVSYSDALSKKIKEGSKVEGQCIITAQTRFGSIYGKITKIKAL